MSTVLRACGDDFDVDAFLVGCSLPVCTVKRRGDPVIPASQPNGRKLERSGVHVSVSDAGFDDFPKQVKEAIAFLQGETEQILRSIHPHMMNPTPNNRMQRSRPSGRL